MSHFLYPQDSKSQSLLETEELIELAQKLHHEIEELGEPDVKGMPQISMSQDVIQVVTRDEIPDLKSNAKFESLKRRHRKAKLTSAEKIIVMNQSPTWL